MNNSTCVARIALLILSVSILNLPAPSDLAAGSRPVIKDLNTPREFPAIDYRTAWEKRAQEIREQALISCGLWPLPEKMALRAHIFGKIEREGYSIEKVYFQPSPGFYLAGNLYRPLGKGRGPFPGVLLPHGHWKEGRLVDSAEASVPALGISFARQGMVAFAYDMVGFNDTRFADSPTNKTFYEVHRLFGASNGDQLWNISLMGLQTWNSIRALDFLESLPDVDKKRLACTGASGGGTQTFMLGAIDDRLAAQAPVCMVSHTMQGGCSCENAPGLRVEYSNMEIAAAAVPRPQVLVAATGDWTKMTLEVEGPAIQKIYDLFGAKDHLRYVRFDFGHNYNQTSREAVYDWFGQWLLKRTDRASLKEQPHQKESDADLHVFPDGKLPDDALTLAQFLAAERERHQDAWQALVPRHPADFKRFKSVTEPLWRHTLGVWQQAIDPLVTKVKGSGQNQSEIELSHSSGARRLRAWQYAPKSKRTEIERTLVLLASEPEKSPDTAASVSALLRRDLWALVLTNYSTGSAADQFTNFFTTYNRTKAQERVRDLVALSQAAGSLDFPPRARPLVVLCGAGQAGLWSLLAAPSAGAVVADCAQVDPTSDELLFAPEYFCPGLRNIGEFEGAAMLAAPHPLLLHNVGKKFPTDAIRATYRALGASKKLRIESRKLSDDEIAEWIAKLK